MVTRRSGSDLQRIESRAPTPTAWYDTGVWMSHSRFHRMIDTLIDYVLFRPHRIVYAHMDFDNSDDFQAACRAVRDRHHLSQ